jgi:hypothetical protein
MSRALAAAVLALALLAVDGGVRDGGAVDAAVADAPSRWEPRPDGGLLDEATGLSDRVRVPVGGRQEVRLPEPVLHGHCDDQGLLRIEGEGDTLFFVGEAPGQTHCGFWFSESPFPHRYVEVTVVGAAAATPDAGPQVPFWAR